MSLITNAIIMAGGEGRRLRPYTNSVPKPMLDVNGKPLLHLILEKLYNYGIRKFYLSVNYLSKIIEDYFGDGSRFGLDISYIKEPFSMGTAGSLALINIIEPSLVMNGDLYTDIDFRDFFVKFRQINTDLFVCCRKFKLRSEFGSVTFMKDKIVGWNEKPFFNLDINCGIYIIKPALLELIPQQHYFGMNNVVESMLKNERDIGYYFMEDDVLWIDIGNLSDYKKLIRILNEE